MLAGLTLAQINHTWYAITPFQQEEWARSFYIPVGVELFYAIDLGYMRFLFSEVGQFTGVLIENKSASVSRGVLRRLYYSPSLLAEPIMDDMPDVDMPVEEVDG